MADKKLLEVSHVSKIFKIGSLLSRKKLTAVDDVSFSIEKDKPVILSIVGESGCGKSTLCKMILRLLDVDKGNIKLGDHNYVEKYNDPKVYRRKKTERVVSVIALIAGLVIALVGAFGMYHWNILTNDEHVGYGRGAEIAKPYAVDSYIEDDGTFNEEEFVAQYPDMKEDELNEVLFANHLERRGYRGVAEDYLISKEKQKLEDNKEYVEGMEIKVSSAWLTVVSNMMKVGTTVTIVGGIIFAIGLIATILANISTYKFRTFRMDVQPIFQNPFEAFSSRKTVDTYLFNTAKKVSGARGRAQVEAAVDKALHSVGLSLEVVRGKYSTQFSGGELQRVSIARALITQPKLIIADEPVAMIDASMKMNIVNLFKELRDSYGISFIYITHDLSTAYYVSDYIATLYRGCLIEYGTSREIMEHPAHPYTKLLMDSVPRVGDKWDTDVAMPDMEDKEYSVTHCKFASRCPYATEECLKARPEMTFMGGERSVLCFHPLVEKNA